MHTSPPIRRWIAGAACAALALGVFAPTAEAGRGRSRGPKVRAWEGTRVVQRVVSPSRTVFVRERSSSVGPAIAGLIGGFVLGATISNAAHATEVRYSYFDPYCDHSFATFDRYERHARQCDHPRIVRVIDVRSGDCVHTYAWRHGDWRREEYRGRGGDDRYHDDRYDDRRDDRDWDDD